MTGFFLSSPRAPCGGDGETDPTQTNVVSEIIEMCPGTKKGYPARENQGRILGEGDV